MAKPPIMLAIIESEQYLRRKLRNAPAAIRPRIHMLLAIVTGTSSADTMTLAKKSNTSEQSIRTWKKIYLSGGADALLREGRGGSEGAIKAADKAVIEKRLADPKRCFKSFEEARIWLNETFGLELTYHAANKYLVRNFGLHMKAGRKSHAQQGETAIADYKKPSREA